MIQEKNNSNIFNWREKSSHNPFPKASKMKTNYWKKCRNISIKKKLNTSGVYLLYINLKMHEI